jgi:hypothetical protein
VNIIDYVYLLLKKTDQTYSKASQKNYHLQCYFDKDDRRIITKTTIDDIVRRLECMKEICDNSLDEKSSLEERRNKFESIKMKYAELKKS